MEGTENRTAGAAEMTTRDERPLRQLAWVFLKLGTIAFGGPAAHIAMMEDEVVRRRKWMTREAFLDLVGVSNLIPGPSSTETAIYIGYARGGMLGILVAGTCFILPAMLIVGVLAWAYQSYGTFPAVQSCFYGVKPVMMAIIAQGLWRLGKTAAKSFVLALIGIAVLIGCAAGANFLAMLLAAGSVSMLLFYIRSGRKQLNLLVVPMLATGTATTLAGSASPGLAAIFLSFLKIGSVIFGSGYVLLAFLRQDMVIDHRWLTQTQLLDSIVIGQVTPGPVFTTATFIGYLLAGPKGAVVATVGIFLPAFILVAITGPFVRLLRKSSLLGAFLDGLNVASLALMALVAYQLARAALVDWLSVAIALGSFALLMGIRNLNSLYLIIPAALVGIIVAPGAR
jgi:chromate transporter